MELTRPGKRHKIQGLFITDYLKEIHHSLRLGHRGFQLDLFTFSLFPSREVYVIHHHQTKFYCPRRDHACPGSLVF